MAVLKDGDSVKPAIGADKKANEHSVNLLDLVDGVKKNAIAPAYNSLAVEPLNVGANVINGALSGGTWLVNEVAGTKYGASQIGKVTEIQVGKAEAGSVASYSQQIFSTAGSFLAYAVAAKFTGKVMRSAGELVPLEATMGEMKIGSSIRAVAQDTRVATVLGATGYAGLRDTKEGETHLSNAASTFVGFTAFEVGNRMFVNPAAGRLLKFDQRYTVGSIGGIAQANTASLINDQKFADPDTIVASGLSGGLLNAIMPSGRHIVDRVVENPLVGGLPHITEATARLHADAAKALPKGQLVEPGSWADPRAAKSLDLAARADLKTKVIINDVGQTRIDQNKNVIFHAAGDGPLDLLQEIAHRRIYKDPKFEQAFQSYGKEIQSLDPADPKNASVKEKYVQTRLEQEVAARTAQNEEAIKLGSARRVSVDANEIRVKEGYGPAFEREASDFIKTNGKTRPGIDYAGAHGGGADGAAHLDGPGGGTEKARISEDTIKQSSLTGRDRAIERNNSDLRDWPDAQRSGTDHAAPTEEYGDRQYHWYEWPEGAHVNGHDNVVWAAEYDVNRDEVMLIKQDPITQERSAVRIRNDGIESLDHDPNGDTFAHSSVEKVFDSTPNIKVGLRDVIYNAELFDANVGLKAVKYDVTDGTTSVPSGTTFTRYFNQAERPIEDAVIYPKASVEYPDGRIDWHVEEPFPNLITEWPHLQEDHEMRYRASVPQSIEGSHRAFTLTPDGKSDGMVDIFADSHPLHTDFGDVTRVDRKPDFSLYHLVDGSAVRVNFFNGRMEAVHLKDGKITTSHFNNPDEGFSEKYSAPWETVFGQVNEVKTTPTKSIYSLVNGGTAELYSTPASFHEIHNVSWAYHDPSGSMTLGLNDAAATKIKVPVGGVDSGIAGLDKAVGVEEHHGPGGFKRYYFADGDAMDVIQIHPQGDPVGIIRKPGSLIINTEENGQWKEINFLFSPNRDHLPQVTISVPEGSRTDNQPAESLVDNLNRRLNLVPEAYPNGLKTKWGMAYERQNFWDGCANLKIVDSAGKLSWIELDAQGNKVTRDAANKIIKVEAEPSKYRW